MNGWRQTYTRLSRPAPTSVRPSTDHATLLKCEPLSVAYTLGPGNMRTITVPLASAEARNRPSGVNARPCTQPA